jgi:hypothetical protein
MIDTTAFHGTPNEYFWTATQEVGAAVETAWRVDFGLGSAGAWTTGVTGFVRCVR